MLINQYYWIEIEKMSQTLFGIQKQSIFISLCFLSSAPGAFGSFENLVYVTVIPTKPPQFTREALWNIMIRLYKTVADRNNDTNYLVPYMIHCTWSKKCPQKLHQPTGIWCALWMSKTQLQSKIVLYYMYVLRDMDNISFGGLSWSPKQSRNNSKISSLIVKAQHYPLLHTNTRLHYSLIRVLKWLNQIYAANTNLLPAASRKLHSFCNDFS